jgi:hypothetical protein
MLKGKGGGGKQKVAACDGGLPGTRKESLDGLSFYLTS